jgi:hypothetical protein
MLVLSWRGSKVVSQNLKLYALLWYWLRKYLVWFNVEISNIPNCIWLFFCKTTVYGLTILTMLKNCLILLWLITMHVYFQSKKNCNTIEKNTLHNIVQHSDLNLRYFYDFFKTLF